MRKQTNIARFIVLTLTLMAGWSAATLPIHSIQSSLAASEANSEKLNDQQPSGAVTNGKIAFDVYLDGYPEIYTINADGSDLQQLTFASRENPPLGSHGALWSPDGTKIAFVRSTISFNDSSQICVMNADGSNQNCLTPTGESADFAAWSPDSTRIAFRLASVSGSTTKASIYVMKADGGEQRNLTNSNPNEFAYNPSWSPDGLKIAFTLTDRGSTTVRVMNADGTNQRDIVNGYLYPNAWSPNGSQLLVSQSGTRAVWAVNADGSSPIKVYEPTPSAAYPYVGVQNAVWSPDGSKVALSPYFCDFTRCLDDLVYSTVMVVQADGSHPTRGVGGGAISPIWSPDGAKIVFADNYSDLFVMNADTSGITQITNGGSVSGPSSWQSVPLVPSAIDDAQFFVQQHYRDFLNREPDADGLAFWTREITSCGVDTQCIEVKRINDSGAFFLSIEFQETGYLVYRFYKASYGNLPNAPVPIRLSEFLSDSQEIGQDVIVRQSGWEQRLESNKQAFANEFVQRSRFVSAYPTSMSSEQFVDALFANSGVAPSASDRTAVINEFPFAATTNDIPARARALRRVAENSTLAQQEFNRAFVLMQYFGYLRRNPNDAPEATLDFKGYKFWLDKLNGFNGNFIQAEMVKAFITSTEYRRRFGP
jgi:Tol biopolymer transport system component